MKCLFLSALLVIPVAYPQVASAQADDANRQAEVPKGEILKFTFNNSKIFPGTTRDCWIYVPKQYDPARPACVYVSQDGIQHNAPAAFDQLIAKKEIPVLIGVFIRPGVVKALSDNALDRDNRSYEYDGLGNSYARFVLEDILPEVEKKTTSDGRAIRLSGSGNDRCIGGESSGAVCAFTAAWERPDQFSRVFSAVGTFVDIRGGNVYPTLIRKTEPKPLRVYLQDGSNDLNNNFGDWWMANQEMERAFKFAGYEVNHSWGDGGHNGKRATEVFPVAMRWLWKDWPAPVKAGAGSKQLQEILVPGEDWKPIYQNHWSGRLSDLVADSTGEVFFCAEVGSMLGSSYPMFYLGVGKPAPVAKKHDPNRAEDRFPDCRGCRAFGADGQMYLAKGEKILVQKEEEKRAVLAETKGLRVGDIAVRFDGLLYAIASRLSSDSLYKGVLVRVSPKGTKEAIEEDFAVNEFRGLAFSPDQSILYVSEANTRWVYSYQIPADGSSSAIPPAGGSSSVIPGPAGGITTAIQPAGGSSSVIPPAGVITVTGGSPLAPAVGSTSVTLFSAIPPADGSLTPPFLGASTAGLVGSPLANGPFLAASALIAGRRAGSSLAILPADLVITFPSDLGSSVITFPADGRYSLPGATFYPPSLTDMYYLPGSSMTAAIAPIYFPPSPPPPPRPLTLKNKQRFVHLHVPDPGSEFGSLAGGLCVDRDGRLYVGTSLGIQICDPAGRVICIVPTPHDRVTHLCFGGANFDTLYATDGGRLYARKLKTRGANGFEVPIKPAAR